MRLRRILATTLACLAASLSCDDSHRTTEPTPVCTVSVDPAGKVVPAEGGTASFAVSTSAATCAWSAAVEAPWVSISAGAAGQGSGVVNYSVAVNVSPDSRTAVVKVDGASHTIQQTGQAPAPECHYGLEPTAAAFSSAGGDGHVAVSATSGCAWTAANSASWITLTSPREGTGNGDVSYTVAPNPDANSRSATLTIATETLTVTQAGASTSCTYRVAPVEFNPCMPAGTVRAQLETGAACPWTVATNSSWLIVTSGTSGRGSREIRVSHSANYDAPRDGVVMVRWPTPTAGQNLRVLQAGCRYGVTKTAIEMPASGGSGTFEVTQQSDPTICGGPKQDACVWTAAADVGWIAVTTPMPQSGDGPVAFTVAVYTGVTSRTGNIRVRDKTVRVTQTAP
jgi:hypothetical protein